MGYSILRQDHRPGAWQARSAEQPNFTQFLSGRHVDGVDTPVRFTLEGGASVPSDFLEIPYFVVSNRMKEALLRCGVDNIEYFEAQLVFEDTQEVVDGYWLGQVVGLVRCVDVTKSTFTSPKRGRLRQFEVDESAAHDLFLFRLYEAPTLVLIHDRVRAALAAAGLEGLFFQATDSYTGKPASTHYRSGRQVGP
jgi:hypothetical protein